MVLFIIAVDGRHLYFTEVVGLSPLIFATALGFFLRLRVEIIVTVIKKFIRAS